jgi:hypothetical protein
VQLRSKFTTFESYANSKTEDVLELLDRGGEKKLIVDHLESGILLSKESGNYDFLAFPAQAQFSPIYTIDTLDYNRDGHLDVLAFGNNTQMKLQLGKSDASYGILLEGDGQGNFKYIDQITSGLDIRGDVRSIGRINDIFLIGINGNSLKAKYLAKDN